jgi:hypothetical protein
MVHDRAGSVMRWTGLDETLANKIIDGLDNLLFEMASDPDHPLREKAEEGLGTLADDLQHSPEMKARVERVKAEIIDNPAMQNWLDGVWEQARAAMLRMARDPDAALAGQFGEALGQLGETLQKDPLLGATINRFVRRAVVGMAADYGDGIVRLVSETVRRHDHATAGECGGARPAIYPHQRHFGRRAGRAGDPCGGCAALKDQQGRPAAHKAEEFCSRGDAETRRDKVARAALFKRRWRQAAQTW